jgi:outer membrane protein OmpA-like peptidoglycan-associated protein
MSSRLRILSQSVFLIASLSTLMLFCVDAHARSTTAHSASVEAYTDQILPVPAPPGVTYEGPLQAGQMTLRDVLKAHSKNKAPIFQPSSIGAAPAVPSAPSTLSAPSVASPSVANSSEGSMLLQGMKSVLRDVGSASATGLNPPQLPLAKSTIAMSQVAEPVTPQNGVVYQPGQAPKSLTVSAPVALPTDNARSSPEPLSLESPAMSSNCQPHVEAWVRTCMDGGYPENFVGEIKGETRSGCAGSDLQDVWVSNTCASPNDSADTNPLSAPDEKHSSDMPPDVRQPIQTSPAFSSDGSCGSANGLATNVRPLGGDLCSSGEPSVVTGDGPWRWSCRGSTDGMTVSCAAPFVTASAPPIKHSIKENARPVAAIEDGVCGSAINQTTDQAPTAGLCAHGDASRVSGDGPWNWACSGRNGGQAVACTASKKINGQCGEATDNGAGEMPTQDLCAAGFASAVTGNGPWNWTCSGLQGGTPALCSAEAKKAAVCGAAAVAGYREAPQTELCSVGQTSAVTGGGPWNWTCSGINGGAAVTCAAPISVSGMCGDANGVAVLSTPSENLCTHGHPSRVTGNGPWLWNCAGADGGDTVSCAAPLGKPEVVLPSRKTSDSKQESVAATSDDYVVCGSAAETVPFAAPEKDLCAKGNATSVSGDGPWSWSCSDDADHSVTCTTPSLKAPVKQSPKEMPAPHSAPARAVAAKKLVDQPVCGAAADHPTSSIPSDGLCANGKATAVRGNGPWKWSCAKGKQKISCEAIKIEDGSCGAANGSIQKFAPTAALCAGGTPTEMQGTGPWLWSCVGAGGGSSASCSASAQATTKVDGACGAASSAPQPSRPSANLCDSGMPSTVYGEGAWTWTCSGLNGGIAASCTAQKEALAAPAPPGPSVNGLCGSANGVATTEQPEDGLCSTGTATNISGNGPWNWTCIGENGGMVVSCTAPLQPPAPITGVCGGASGVATLVTPRSGLCAAGISSAVNGKGPWTWSCSGTNGGGAVACVAPIASGSDTGMPSLVTPSVGNEAPTPKAAPTSSVTAKKLVTPHLPAGPLPPLETGTMPKLVPSKPFHRPREASELPPVPAPGEKDQSESSAAPAAKLPSKPLGLDSDGNRIAGNHLVLTDDISMLSFTRGSDVIEPSMTETLDKLVATLQSTAGSRITLTSYAGVADNVTPREARRLSLSRALAVRDYLSSKGVSSGRVDVRALGANVPSGDTDRVDIKAN